MLPSKPVDWMTPSPVVEQIRYPSQSGPVEGQLYRPSTDGPHPGILVCLGVVPFGVEHPQVAVLGKALARAGFAALLYWSPAMRDYRLNAVDIENIPLAYDWLIGLPYVDPAHSGLLGTCVGAAFALMASASALIRDRIAFIATYAPYASMWTFALDIASASRSFGGERQPWQVDPLTRKVFVHSRTAYLPSGEAEALRKLFESENDPSEPEDLSAEGRVVYALLASRDMESAEKALAGMPATMQEQFSTLSPENYVQDIHAPLIVQMHDIGDPVIPVSESRQLRAALEGKTRLHYTEMQFHHLDPSKAKMSWPHLAREFGKFFLTVFPLFRQAVKG